MSRKYTVAEQLEDTLGRWNREKITDEKAGLEIQTAIAQGAREVVKMVCAAALADPGVDTHAKSFAGYALQYLGADGVDHEGVETS